MAGAVVLLALATLAEVAAYYCGGHVPMIEFAFRLDRYPAEDQDGLLGYLATIRLVPDEYQGAFLVGRLTPNATPDMVHAFCVTTAVRLAKVLKNVEWDYIAGGFLAYAGLHVPPPMQRYSRLLDLFTLAPEYQEPWDEYISRCRLRFVGYQLPNV